MALPPPPELVELLPDAPGAACPLPVDDADGTVPAGVWTDGVDTAGGAGAGVLTGGVVTGDVLTGGTVTGGTGTGAGTGTVTGGVDGGGTGTCAGGSVVGTVGTVTPDAPGRKTADDKRDRGAEGGYREPPTPTKHAFPLIRCNGSFPGAPEAKRRAIDAVRRRCIAARPRPRPTAVPLSR